MTRVTSGGWGVSVTTGSGITGAILHVYKHHTIGGKHLTQRGEGYGLQFPSREAAFAWAFNHGYEETYYSRTWCRQHRTLHTFLGRPSPTFGRCIHE